MNEGLDLTLGPGWSSHIQIYKEFIAAFGINLTYSKAVAFFEMNTIAARVYKSSVPLFSYFKCFPVEIWVLLLSSVIILALVSKFSTNATKLKSFGYYVWNYSIVFISKSLNEYIVKSVHYSILSLWLWSALNLTILFTAYLMDFMVTTVPEVRIRTLEDLSQRKDNMKIVVRVDSILAEFAKNRDNGQLANDLGGMLDHYYDYDKENVSDKIFNKLPEGEIAYINGRLFLIFDLVKISIEKNSPDFLNSIYISKESASYEPYFLFFNENSPAWFHKALGKT